MDSVTKEKISQTMKNKTKSYTHRQNISNGLKEYWKNVPNRPTKTDSQKQEKITACQGDKTCNSVSKNKQVTLDLNDKI